VPARLSLHDFRSWSGALASLRTPSARSVLGHDTSLPLVSVLAFIWLWRDTGDTVRIAALAQSTFWFVLPSLPMFLVLPVLLRSGAGFWLSLALGSAR
jgi:hypothetical protein